LFFFCRMALLLLLMMCSAWGQAQLPVVVPNGEDPSPNGKGEVEKAQLPPPSNPFRQGGGEANPFRQADGGSVPHSPPSNPFRQANVEANPFRQADGGSVPPSPPSNPFRQANVETNPFRQADGGSVPPSPPSNPFRQANVEANPFRAGSNGGVASANPFRAGDKKDDDDFDDVYGDNGADWPEINPYRKVGRGKRKTENPFRAEKKKKDSKNYNPFRRDKNGKENAKKKDISIEEEDDNPYFGLRLSGKIDPEDIRVKEPLVSPPANATEVRCMKSYFRQVKVELRVRKAEQVGFERER
jgi:hypothetical protein